MLFIFSFLFSFFFFFFSFSPLFFGRETCKEQHLKISNVRDTDSVDK